MRKKGNVDTCWTNYDDTAVHSLNSDWQQDAGTHLKVADDGFRFVGPLLHLARVDPDLARAPRHHLHVPSYLLHHSHGLGAGCKQGDGV